MLNTFYLWSELVSCSPENVLFEVADYDVCKTDAACKKKKKKKCRFSMPALTYSAWQQSKVGSGLGGQLPFTGSARGPPAPLAGSPTCV